MLIYLLTVLLLLFLCQINKYNGKKTPEYIGFLLLFIISAFRSESIGIDLETYISKYTSGEDHIDFRYGIEFGYYIINYVASRVSLSPFWFIFFISVISLVPLFILIRLESKNPVFTILLFFILINGFGFFLTGIRQSIALVIVLWSFFYFYKKKILVSIILILVASTVHFSSLISFILLFGSLLIPKNNTRLLYWLLMCSLIIGFAFKNTIFDFLNFMPLLPGNNVGFEKYLYYKDFANTAIPNFRGLFIMIIPQTIFTFYSIKYQNQSLFTKILFIGVLLTNTFASTPMIPRYFVYGTILQIFVVPSFFPLLNKKEKIVIFAIITLLIVYFLSISLEINGINNYTFIKL